MTITIEPSYALTPGEIQELHALVDQVTQHDGAPPMMYWPSIQHRSGESTQDFLLRDDRVLVGYLGWFNFGDGVIEICAMVHPDHRRAQYFSRLLEQAKRAFAGEGAQGLVFGLEEKHRAARYFVQHHSGVIRSTIWDLLLSQQPDYAKQISQFQLEAYSPAALIPAAAAQVSVLASLDEACFQTDYDDVLYQYAQHLKDPLRRIWIFYQGDVAVGKVHARLEGDTVVIHDFCVLPGERGRGLGKFLIIEASKRLFELYRDHPALVLKLEAENPLAVALYQSLGFHIDCVYTYWFCRFI